jgi:hypothetical protein
LAFHEEFCCMALVDGFDRGSHNATWRATGWKPLVEQNYTVSQLSGYKASFTLQAEPSRAEPNRTELIRLGKQSHVMKWKHSH